MAWGKVQRNYGNSSMTDFRLCPICFPAMFPEPAPNWPSTSHKSRCIRPTKMVIATTFVRGTGICWEALLAKGTFGWLRGVDLNHRPLGYEATEDSNFNNLQDAGGSVSPCK